VLASGFEERGSLGEAKGKPVALPTKKTFSQLAEEYVERRRREVDARTVEYWQWALEHLSSTFGDKKLSGIRVEHVKAYMVQKQKERDEGDGLSNASINKTLKVLAQILDEAIEEGLLTENVARGKKRRLKAGKPIKPWALSFLAGS
jgi:hypothetical protein